VRRDSAITSAAEWQLCFPYLVGLLAARLPLGHAIGTYAGAAYLLMVIAALALPETGGRDLRSVG